MANDAQPRDTVFTVAGVSLRPQVFFSSLLTALVVLQTGALSEAEVSKNLLRNPSFEEGVDEQGIPAGWRLYGGQGREQLLRLVEVAHTGRKALLIEDGDPTAEIGLMQTLPLKPDLTYEASARVRAVEGFSPYGAYLQLRFLPSNKYVQTSLAATSAEEFETVAVRATAPPDTEQATVYLYTHRSPTPRVIVDSVRLVSGVEPPPPPPPEPIPPVYTKLKDLHLTTELVKEGGANITIITPASGLYDQQAARLQRAIAELTGVRVPIATDDSPAGAVPIRGNLIALGNRSTNHTIGELYNRYYTLLDLRYPGPEGYVVRTLHNPFGDGHNVIFVGGSDLKGVETATDVLIRKLREAGAKRGSLALGWLAEIQLGRGITGPKDVREAETWEASAGYGSVGYFGWNSISKHMALYYMTGDEFHAREFLRLAFPDEQAKREIAEIDGERIENKDDPLAGPYHYNAHLMILFWDLIEESPVFTDEERLRVTNAFARQLNHRKGEGIYGRTEPPPGVGSRHGQWSALSLYCLGRYFQKDYPDPIWQHCVEAAKLHFAPLHQHAWVSGESDNLFWYNTATAPILVYMLLTGDREPLRNGVLPRLLRGQEILISGRRPDWALRYAAISFLHQAAYLTQDGRWLTYRDRTGVDLSVFRLGQSFWPEEHLQPRPPTDLVGKWSIHPLPKPMWRARGSGLPFAHSFQFGSFRSAPDASGDFILIDGFNGASRNPYHTFAILELRLAGRTLLQGYWNQVLTWADGLMEPQVAMDAALRYREVVGQTAVAVAEVPKAAYCNWRRTLAQRVGRYALLVDDLTFRADSDNLEVQIKWQGKGFRPLGPVSGALRLGELSPPPLPPGWKQVRALDSECRSEPSGPGVTARLDRLGLVLLRATQPGAWLEMAFQLPEPLAGELFADLVNYRDRGIVRLWLDGKPVVDKYDHRAPSAEPRRVPLGRHELAAGKHRLRVEVVAKHPGVEKCYLGLAGLSIRPEGAPPAAQPPAFEIRLCDPVRTTLKGDVATMNWRGPVKEGQHRIFFSLLGAGTACVRVAGNAAALALPKPALAVVGEYAGVQGELVVLAEDHLYGHGLTRVSVNPQPPAPSPENGEGEAKGTLVTAEVPVDVDWDFASGTLHVLAARQVNLGLALASPAGLRLHGQPLFPSPRGGENGLTTFALPAGRHVLEGAMPGAEMRQKVAARLATLLAQGREKHRQRLAALKAEPRPTAPALQTAFTAKVGGRVVALTLVPTRDETLLAVAEGKKVHLLTPEGKEVRTLATEGPIRVLRWWPEAELLLMGCTDEKVIAFDLNGNRKWVFISEMDPAVFRAAKTYWFKSAPGHEGIHGLYTGVFLPGRSQAFVGSACTLEILDENGQLVKRLPVFWGTGAVFAIINGPEGSLNLLVGRSKTDGPALAIINNRTLDPRPRGFYTVPPGHTYVGGWANMSRWHLFYEDLDGDGVKEVVSEINGVWNRVTVWDAQGRALYNANFGPGDPIPAKNIRDLDLADLDSDGRKEILVATSSGLVVALDCQCQKVWARRLSSPPRVLKGVIPQGATTPWIVVGCEDGTVAVLDGRGELMRLGQVAGRPTDIEAFSSPAAGSVVLLATDQGEVKAFGVGE